jgi:hypothetical protein
MVMATGVVSLALALDGEPTVAHILLALAAVQWIALGLVAAMRFARHPAGALTTRSPATLTAVAGTAVLATGLTGIGWTHVGIVLLAVSLTLWLALIGGVLARFEPPATGVSLMVTVSTESLAILGAVVGMQTHARWLVAGSLLPLAAGLALYWWVIARFDFAELARGAGDQWVTGGALAISAFAASRVALAAQDLHTLGDIAGFLRGASVALLLIAVLWLPPLLVGEAARPRPRYHLARWSTVFPLGMYATAGFDVGKLALAPVLWRIASVWTWVAVAAWSTVFAGLLRRALRAPAP